MCLRTEFSFTFHYIFGFEYHSVCVREKMGNKCSGIKQKAVEKNQRKFCFFGWLPVCFHNLLSSTQTTSIFKRSTRSTLKTSAENFNNCARRPIKQHQLMGSTKSLMFTRFRLTSYAMVSASAQLTRFKLP